MTKAYNYWPFLSWHISPFITFKPHTLSPAILFMQNRSQFCLIIYCSIFFSLPYISLYFPQFALYALYLSTIFGLNFEILFVPDFVTFSFFCRFFLGIQQIGAMVQKLQQMGEDQSFDEDDMDALCHSMLNVALDKAHPCIEMMVECSPETTMKLALSLAAIDFEQSLETE